MDECPLCASVFCKLLHRSVRMVRQRSLWAVCRQQRLRCTISRCHVFECVENPHGANFWFRRLKFTHATVLTLTNGNCCRKFALERVLTVCARCVFVARYMRSAVAKGASHFSEFCFSHDDVWYSECDVLVLRIAFFVQGVCVV